MAGKRGSRIAAAQARARAAAKKKSRQGGPVLPAAAYVTPETASEAETDTEAAEVNQTPAPQPTQRRVGSVAASTPLARSIGVRRERRAVPAVTGASLKRELAMIGSLTLVSGVVMVVLKLFTNLGA